MIEIKVFVNYINPFLVLGCRMSTVPSYESFESNNTQYKKQTNENSHERKAFDMLPSMVHIYLYITLDVTSLTTRFFN